MTQVQVEKMGAASEIQHADGRVVQAVERRKRAEAEEVAALLDARALGVHQALGFASVHEYAEARLQLPPRLAYERVRVVEALTTLPRTRAALAAGVVGYSVVRELTRVVTPANELTWLERAAGCTAREVERLVAGHVLGADPDDTPDPAEVLTLVSFELTPATRALLREARQQLHR
ncbi:MAG: hypothetical protein IT370_24780, partial [Deltaproteobacteria bacterium]|nr:hypothetical protein [Deltaproteobacteria bacterium]